MIKAGEGENEGQGEKAMARRRGREREESRARGREGESEGESDRLARWLAQSLTILMVKLCSRQSHAFAMLEPEFLQYIDFRQPGKRVA